MYCYFSLVLIHFLLFVLYLDSTYKLCLKDLSEAMIMEVRERFEADLAAKKWFHQSFGLDSSKRSPNVLRNIGELFPDTPVKMLKEVCEALKLYDLAELLERAKPRTLRPAIPLKEIEKLPNARNRPTTFYSKTAVLIIDHSTDAANDNAERIGSFFKVVNSRSEVTAVTLSRPLMEISEVLRGLRVTWKFFELGFAESEEKVLKSRLENVQKEIKCYKKSYTHEDLVSRFELEEKLIEQESALQKELGEQMERRKNWKKERKSKIEKLIKQKEDKLQKEMEKLQLTISPAMDKWINNEGRVKL